ncbi:MAG: DUF3082 domain-containing protein [Xenococcaceae cyanobacterium MO_207.B15]|nr:DUF3082 domain-containing protein [Xenococcaceae cyanobacterium MO_207.B15]MDJ0746703.1 DUF3082 domain-containing protein [Xenococcaceae cyanobacterium MO_167.B27]
MSNQTPDANKSNTESPKKKVTVISCIFASTFAGAIAIAIYYLMSSIIETYADKPVVSDNILVLKITVAVRTLVIGMAALGTGVFGLVAIGLFLLGIQVAIKDIREKMG